MSALTVPVPLASQILKSFAFVSYSRVMSAFHEAKLSACYLVLMEDYPEKAASVDLFVECIGKLRSNGIKINENGLKGVPAVLLKNLVPNKAKYNDERLWLEYEMTARVGCMVFMQQASIYIMEKGELYRQLREITKTEKGSIYLWMTKGKWDPVARGEHTYNKTYKTFFKVMDKMYRFIKADIHRV